jgi:hypothetical protein
MDLEQTGCHDVAEILLKVALSTKNQIKSMRIIKVQIVSVTV